MRARTTLAVLAAACAMALAAPAASADRVSVAINGDAAGQAKYTGKVKAAGRKSKCAKRRTIQFFHGSEGFFIGQTTTDGKGRYLLYEFVPRPGQPVRLVVLEKRRRQKNCRAFERSVIVPEDVVIVQGDSRD